MKGLRKYNKNERIVMGTGFGIIAFFLISMAMFKTTILLIPMLFTFGLIAYVIFGDFKR